MTDRGRDEYGQFVPYLPRYNDGGKSYLELHANHTGWELENEKKNDEDYIGLVNLACEMFQQETGVEIYLLGRSGRHVCVEDTPENSKRYQQLKKVALRLEQFVIENFNREEVK